MTRWLLPLLGLLASAVPTAAALRDAVVWMPVAGCRAGVAGSYAELPASNAPTPVCISGTNITTGALQYSATTEQSVQLTYPLPSTWSTTDGITTTLWWRTAGTSGGNTWCVAVSCAVPGTVTFDQTFSADTCQTNLATGASQLARTVQITPDTTSCGAGDYVTFRIKRQGTNGSDTLTDVSELLGVTLIYADADLNLSTIPEDAIRFGAGTPLTYTYDASSGTDCSVIYGNASETHGCTVTSTGEFIAGDPGDGLRRLQLKNNTATCEDPPAGFASICEVGAEPFFRTPGGTQRELLYTAGGDYGDLNCASGTCTLDATQGSNGQVWKKVSGTWQPAADDAGSGSLASLASPPFTCSSTTGGVYYDTTGSVVCVCNETQAKWCRSDTGDCNANNQCVTTTTSTAGTTTSTAATTTSTAATTTSTTLTSNATDWSNSFIAYWNMEDATSATRVQSGGTCGSTCNLTNNVTVTQDNTHVQGGYAAGFQSADSDYLSCDWSIAGGCDEFVLTGNTDVTYGAFVRRTDTSANHPVFKALDGSYNPKMRLQLAQFGSPTNSAQCTLGNTLVQGAAVGATTWAFVACTYDNSTAGSSGDNFVHAYVMSGASTNSDTSSSPTTLASLPTGRQENFEIGANTSGGTYDNGQIDMAFVASKALTQAQLCRICSCGINGADCTCSGSSYTSEGRNDTDCGGCTLPACDAAAP